MGDYPDPDEEYELMYADDLELLREMDDDTDTNPVRAKTNPAKRSLNFSSPIATKISTSLNNTENQQVHNNSLSLSQSLQPLEDVLTPNNVSSQRQDIHTSGIVSNQNILTPVNVSNQDILTPINENASNKRTAEDLFGDINDIDFDNFELPSKKQKTEEEIDMDLINKIIEGRKIRQMLAEPASRGYIDKKPNFNVKENLTRNIPRWPFVPFTKWDGERVYVRLESEESWEDSLDRISEKLTLQTTYAATWEEARKILEAKNQQKESNESVQEVQSEENNEPSDLWVERYRPKSYIDLLSEEPVNRALLHWLHLWDKVVFKKDVKTKEPQHRNAFSKRTGQFQLSNKWKGKKENEPEMDEDGRPHHKVALLCGPPGVGKTTLAHLLARLAGYRPVELNASDERSTEAFQTALQSATLMRSVLDADRRPNCLILDEIDGAPIQTVELLVKWCTASASKKEDGKKKSKSQPLKRPVIAICNDLYATSLRPLRPVSLIVTVGSITPARLAARLSIVAKCEKLRVHPRVIAALAARAQGDIRAALHVLSFLKARAKEQVNIEDVENASIGIRDNAKSMMQALQAIFTLNDDDPSAILRTIQAAGEYDRVIDGIFENYLSARCDSRLLIACETMSWLRLYDAINSWTMRHQNYSLYGLLPICIARCHSILATRQSIKVKFPMQAQEMYRRKTELDSIVWSVWSGSSANVATTRTALRLDILPLLPYLLSPALRSANVQLCSENEKKSLMTCAGAMCDYGLQYIQQRTAQGLYAFMLEPDVYKIAFFGNEDCLRPSPAVRQAIATEQQLEVLRRNEEMMSRMSIRCQSSSQAGTTKPKVVPQPTTSEDAKGTRLPNHLQRLQPKAVQKIVPQVQKDFFGRIVPITQAQKQDAVSDVISSSSVFYQYREGFNNAVRRNVRMRDLL
ncbi:chromosome transmission fidelity protein 18 homolog isoform X3 [Maniola jurtina]|uniref:chromosome transmission fidelity protein 18 homolog isoform X3 n=1 Tax=Maniola jurtina TaxID=191418 RepID=UPI001E686CB3|nr:chromosome transmission fidelity protein 18 homolog isoform X3 [Maniola jurtina]